MGGLQETGKKSASEDSARTQKGAARMSQPVVLAASSQILELSDYEEEEGQKQILVTGQFLATKRLMDSTRI